MFLESLIVLVAIPQSLLRQPTYNAGRHLAMPLGVTGTTGTFQVRRIVVLKIFVQPVDFPIILHYNVYFGVDVLDDWRKVYIMPLIGVFLLIINTLLGLYFYKNNERIASHILAMASLMIQLSLLVASASIILINY